MNELNALLANIPLLPEWAQLLLPNLLGICKALLLVYLIQLLVQRILKGLATPPIRPLLKSLKKLCGEGLQRAARSLELPVEYPRVALVAPAIDAGFMYLFFSILFLFSTVFLMLGVMAGNIVFSKRLIAFAAAGGSMVAARYYFASAERQRIKLKERWQAFRKRRKP